MEVSETRRSVVSNVSSEDVVQASLLLRVRLWELGLLTEWTGCPLLHLHLDAAPSFP